MKAKQTLPLLLLALIWGIYYVASHKAVEGMSVFTTGIVIRFITLILLTVIMLFQNELSALIHVKGAVPRLLLIGLMGFLLDLMAFIGLQKSPAGIGTALLKTDILFVNLISIFVYKQKFSRREWFFTLVMLFGVFLVMNLNITHLKSGGGGEIFFILSALFVSINAFLIKGAQRSRTYKVSNMVIAYYNNFVTMILFIAASLIMGTVSQLKLFGSDSFVTVSLLIAGLGQTLVYIVYYYDLKKYPVWLVKVFLLFMPIVSATISFIFFSEKLTAEQMTGILVVILGAMGILSEQRKKESSEILSAV